MTSDSHPDKPPRTRAAELSPLSVFHIPPQIRPRYRRLALVSLPRHLEKLNLSDETTLIVHSDWLSWCRLAAEGHHVLHLEAAFTDYDPPADYHVRVSEWVYVDGKDVTLFDGISLGKVLNRPVEQGCMAFDRLRFALDGICQRFAVEEILLYDVRSDLGLADDAMKRLVLATIARARGIRLVDDLDSATADDPSFFDVLEGAHPTKESGLKTLLRGLYGRVANRVFRARTPCPVLLILNGETETSMLTRYPGDTRVAPLLLAERSPKSMRFLLDCWRRGIGLARFAPANLSAEEAAAVARIKARLLAHWEQTPDPTPSELGRRQVLRSVILDTGILMATAREAKAALHLMSQHRVGRIIAGDATNPLGRVFTEAARVRGVPVDGLLNGMYFCASRYDVYNGDQFVGPAVSRILTWGEQQEDWKQGAVSPQVASLCSGFPGIDNLPHVLGGFTMPPVGEGRVVVLPAITSGMNLRAPRNEVLPYLVETVQMLRELGYRDILLKLHPSIGNMGYVERMVRDFDLGCRTIKVGRVLDLLPEADLVIGPVESGAMVETLAAGCPYFGLVVQPSSIDTSRLPGFGAYRSVAELRRALVAREIPDRDTVLQYVCSYSSITESALHIWQHLGRGA